MNRILLSLAALALLATTSCKKKSSDSAPLQSGRIQIVNGLTNQAIVAYIADTLRAQLAYKAQSAYVSSLQGVKTFVIDKDNIRGDIFSTTQTISPTQTFSFFVCPTSPIDVTKADGLFVTDSLGKTNTGQAYVRYVNLIPSTTAGAGYSITDVDSGAIQGIGNNRGYKTATSFRPVPPHNARYKLLDPSNFVVKQITLPLLANRFYTIVSCGDPTVTANAGLDFFIYENSL